MLDGRDFAEWESGVFDRNYMSDLPLLLPNARHTYSKEQFDERWAQYQHLFQGEKDLRRQRYGVREMQEVLQKLSKLKFFNMSTGNHRNKRSEYSRKASSAGLHEAFGDDGGAHTSAVPQLLSILLIMHHAGIKPHHFAVEMLAGNFFAAPRVTSEHFRER